MATRSTKIDLVAERSQSQVQYTRKQVAGFTEDLKPVVRDLSRDPVKYLSGEKKLSPLGAVKNAVSVASEGSPNVSLNSASGNLSVPFSKDISSFASSISGMLSALQSLLSTTKSLLEVIRQLAINLDDALHLLVKAALSNILDFLDLLSPRIGVHALFIPPNPPGRRISEDSIDSGVLAKYASLSESLRDITNDPTSLAVRDRDYYSKTYSGALGTDALKKLITASLDDKHDKNRPYAGSSSLRINTGDSAGVLLTAGGNLTNLLSIYRKWCSLFGYPLPDNTNLPRATITDLGYTKSIDSSSYDISVTFNLKSHRYIPHQPALYLPYKYRVLVYQGDRIPEPFLSEYIWSLGSSEVGEFNTDVVATLHGVIRLSFYMLEYTFENPFSSRVGAVTNALVRTYYSNREYIESIPVPSTGDYRIAVSVQSRDSTKVGAVRDWELTESTVSRTISLEAKKSSKSKAAPPNWYGGDMQLGPLDGLDTKIREVAELVKSLVERNVVSPLDAAIQTVQDYLDIISRLRTSLSDLLSVLKLLSEFQVGGYASVFKADSGLSGLKKSVDEHFATMAPHPGETMAAIMLVAESDYASDLEVFLTLAKMLFGTGETSQDPVTCSLLPIGSGLGEFTIPEVEPVTGLPDQLRC
jgi:hypothetical protein